jgi:glycosyltransferase involved in cell wall biosynthesis
VNIRYLLHNAYGIGGTIRTVFNQASALCERHDVEIASVYRHTDQPALPLDPRVRLVPLTELTEDGKRRGNGPRRALRKARMFGNPLPHRHDFRYERWDPQVDLRIVRWMRERRDGVLVTTRPGHNLLSAWFGPRKVIRIGQDHMNFASYKPSLKSAIVQGYPRLDAVTVLTRADFGSYREALGPSVRLELVPNGIPARLPVPDDVERAPMIAAAGRLSRQKGFDLLIEAFASIHAAHPGWELHIFGEGKSRRKLTRMIEERELGESVRLRGLSRNLEGELAKASIFALSSRKEGLPMVLLEAMSSGLPVVAFDCPTGPADVVEDGRNGLLIPAEDVDGLAAGLSRLIQNGPERAALGEAARVTGTRYEMPVIAAQWEELFAELAGVSTRGRSRTPSR